MLPEHAFLLTDTSRFPTLEATADVAGNLGDASVVLSTDRSDWLKDRWQSAKDMSGRSIPGPHWLAITWPPGHRITSVERIIVNYEIASCDDYSFSLVAARGEAGGAELIHDSQVPAHSANTVITKDGANKRVVHDMKVENKAAAGVNYDMIRLDMWRPATEWGTSVWSIEVFGLVEEVI